ncbi:MAG: hypothetical protein K9N51_00690 [Candidatus Pacebacteria bacterium]|nr:hypothetical protein [Candidatus Paceibacterota bacterium]
MSKECALKNLNLESADRWAHTEYSLGYHPQFLEALAGVPEKHPEFSRRWKAALQIDFNFLVNDGLIDWADTGRVTDMGHAVYAEDGSDKRQAVVCPFQTLEEVWAFDAVEEYGLPDKSEQVAAYEKIVREARENEPEQLTPGGTYKTIVSGAIQTFGWDMLLMGASDPHKMEKVFDSFFRRTLFLHECWAETSAEVVLTHDDFVWSCGAFMSPDIYREVIIPRYAQLWTVAHNAGKKVMFCADGNFMEFAGDIVEAGADALIFEPMNDFDFMADNFGQACCLVGSFVDCRDLTFNNWSKVERDIDRTFTRLRDCRGAMLAVGNHLPANIPEEMLKRYFDTLLPRLEK